MKYKTIRIDKEFSGSWYYSVHLDQQDRKKTKTVPNALGFYHFPETMSDKEAFAKLKDRMLLSLREDFDKISTMINNLDKLSFIETKAIKNA